MEQIVNGFQSLMEIQQFETFFKLILIVILAGVVGYERESWKKPAGFRTYVLVGISAVLVMICGELLHEKDGADPTRIPAQLLSGIGFLGAGTILRDGFNVKGLTTAAALLAITCIGLIVGAGFYLCGIIATFVVYCLLSYSHLFSNTLERFCFLDLEIAADNPKDIIENIKEILTKEKIEITKMKIIDDEDKNYIKLEAKYKDNLDTNKIVSNIMKIKQVKEVLETRQMD